MIRIDAIKGECMSDNQFDPKSDVRMEGLGCIKTQLQDMMLWPSLPEVLSLLADVVEERAEQIEQWPKHIKHEGHLHDLSDRLESDIRYRRLVAKELRCLSEPRTVRTGRRAQR